jgi:hypothetical protein
MELIDQTFERIGARNVSSARGNKTTTKLGNAASPLPESIRDCLS